MDGDGAGFDLTEVINAIDSAEVLVIRFDYMRPRLLADFRISEIDPPVCTLVPQASAIEERFRSVKRARPRMPLPDRIISFHWPRHAQALRDAGLWTRMVDRLASSGERGIAERCESVWREILRAERQFVVEAIKGGESYQTLWERSV